MSYLFRYVGQVLGVAASASIIQAILKVDLARNLTGHDANKVSEVLVSSVELGPSWRWPEWIAFAPVHEVSSSSRKPVQPRFEDRSPTASAISTTPHHTNPQIIAKIRQSTSTISHLSPAHRTAAVNAYDHALHIVFICNLGSAILGGLGFLLVENVALPGAGGNDDEEVDKGVRVAEGGGGGGGRD